MALSPMEINPEMLNKLLKKVGVSPTVKFVDVLGFESDYLKSFSHDVCAVLLLFPLTQQHEEFRKKQDDEHKDKEPDAKVYFMKQTMENSCGIVGLIHATASNKDKLSFGECSHNIYNDFFQSFQDKYPLVNHDAYKAMIVLTIGDKDSALKNFLDKSADASPDDRAKLLEENKVLCSAHNSIAAEGHCRPSEDGVHFHLIVFTNVNGHLYEIDGLTAKPIDHGPNKGTLLEGASKICKQFTEREVGDVRFSSVALVKAA